MGKGGKKTEEKAFIEPRVRREMITCRNTAGMEKYGKKGRKKSLDSKKGGCYTPDDKYKIGVMNYGRWPASPP